MLRDDDETVAIVRWLCQHRGSARARDAESRMGARMGTPGAICTVDELHAVTLRSWATFYAGEILTPIAVEPFVPDPCLTHFLGVVARECRSTETGRKGSIAYRRETER